MEYIISIGIILVLASAQTLVFNKRIEQTIPISVVEIILAIYVFGLFDKLILGVRAVELIALIALIIILLYICKQKERKRVKEILLQIVTPGAIVYIILCVMSIIVNKDRIFQNTDEFYHWGKMIKNMYLYGTFGTNKNSIITYNDYPPFTSIFQYFFLSIGNVYKEDIVITAHNILYFSFIIQLTKNIKWDKSLKNLIILVPTIVLVPLFFYDEFYLNILVDGFIGIVFGLIIYNIQGENSKFKNINIFSMLIALALTKTTGIALSGLAVVIILIRNILNKDKREIKNICIIAVTAIILISTWYIKVRNADKNWDFTNYIKENQALDSKNVIQNFTKAIFDQNSITGANLTTFSVYIVLIGFNFFILKTKKDKDYKYYSVAMIVSVPIYLIGLLLTYLKIFDLMESNLLACYSRYCSTILLALFSMQIATLTEYVNLNFKNFIVMLGIISVLIPKNEIQDKYLNSKTYILTAQEERNVDTKIKMYKKYLNENDSILFITGTTLNEEILVETNRYELMPIKIEDYDTGNFNSVDELINLLSKKNYTYIYIYKEDDNSKEIIKTIFEDEYVGNNMMYKISNKDNHIFLERVKY